MDPRQNLELARRLVDVDAADPLAEAHYRCACGRGYYSAFIVARNYLESRGLIRPGRNPGVHGDVTNLLEGSALERVQVLAHRLKSLRLARNTCDYDLRGMPHEPYERLQAETDLATAADVVGELDDVAKNDPSLGVRRGGRGSPDP